MALWNLQKVKLYMENTGKNSVVLCFVSLRKKNNGRMERVRTTSLA